MDATMLRLLRVWTRLKKGWIDWRGTSGQVYFEQRVDEYRRMWRAVAADLGASFHELESDLWELELEGRTLRVRNHELPFDDPVTLRVAGNKPLVHRLLRAAGLPVPPHLVFRLDEVARACEFLASHPAGCVVKPARGYGGRGVSTHLLSRRDVRRAAVLASLFGRDLLIEPHFPGESVRVLVLNGSAVHAVRRRALTVTGDGQTTVAALLAARGLPLDRDARLTLRAQGLTADARPARGAQVRVRCVPPAAGHVELRTVYDETVTATLHPSVSRAAEEAARVVGSSFLGVDFLLFDAAAPLGTDGGVINEVNTTPALHHHYDPESEPYPAPAWEAACILLREDVPAS